MLKMYIESLAVKLVDAKKFLGKVFKPGSFIRYPVVRQHDPVDCGPAALLSILRYYGGNCSLAEVREMCHTGIDGTSMFDLISAARFLGFRARGVSAEYDDLLRERLPCIAFVIREGKHAHYLVIYRINRRNVLLGDPARGLYKLARIDFIHMWKMRILMLLEPGGQLYKRETKTWFQWLWPYLWQYRSWIWQSVFWGIIYAVLGLILALFVQKIVDVFIPTRDIQKVIVGGVLILMIITLRSIGGYFRQRFLISLNKKIGIKISRDFISQILQLPKRFLDNRRTGDITSRLNDIMRVQHGVLLVIGTTVIDVMVIGCSLIVIFTFSASVGFLILITTPVYLLFLILKVRNLSDRQKEAMQSFTEVQSTYIDTLQGFEEIINFSAQYLYQEKNSISFCRYQERMEILDLLRSRLTLGIEQIGNIILLTLLVCGSVFVVRENLLLGQMMACYGLVAGMLPSLTRLVEGFMTWQGVVIAVQRLLDLMQIEKEKNTGLLIYTPANIIRINNVIFKWSDRHVLFDKLSLSLQRGKLTALWGPTGSGKSTLMQLLQRKYSLPSGEIQLGCNSIENFELRSYRNRVGIVPQQVRVFNGTLGENILLGRQVASVEGFINLLKKYQFDEYLEKFERGLLTIIGENGRHLSGGELQILGLARALLNEPDLLIIDEGLNALDLQTEQVMFRNLKQYAGEHFVLISTHDLAMISRMDYLYVLNRGKILQAGTPECLICQHGYFNSVWKQWKNNLEESPVVT